MSQYLILYYFGEIVFYKVTSIGLDFNKEVTSVLPEDTGYYKFNL